MNNQFEMFTDKELSRDLKAEEKFQKERRKELLKAENRRRDNELREIKQSNRYQSEKRKKCTTTKILMYLIFLNCGMIEIYSMWVMYKLCDLSALYSLIGAVIGESISYAIYCAKSFNDSKEEAKSKLERDKFEREMNSSDININPEDVSNTTEDPIPTDDDHSGDIPTDVVMENTDGNIEDNYRYNEEEIKNAGN